MVKRLPTMREAQVQSLGQEDLLEKEIAIPSSIVAWKIPWMEEPGRLQSMGSQSWTQLSDFTFFFKGNLQKPELLVMGTPYILSTQFFYKPKTALENNIFKRYNLT